MSGVDPPRLRLGPSRWAEWDAALGVWRELLGSGDVRLHANPWVAIEDPDLAEWVCPACGKSGAFVDAAAVAVFIVDHQCVRPAPGLHLRPVP